MSLQQKNKTGTTLRVALNVENMLHELLPTVRLKTIINAFANNMSTDIRLSKAQLSKIIQIGGFLGALLGKFASPLMNVAVPLAKNVLTLLAIMVSVSTVDGTILGHKVS